MIYRGGHKYCIICDGNNSVMFGDRMIRHLALLVNDCVLTPKR